jgi:hypothetical protein
MSAATASRAKTTSAVATRDGWAEAVEFMGSMLPRRGPPVVGRANESGILPEEDPVLEVAPGALN